MIHRSGPGEKQGQKIMINFDYYPAANGISGEPGRASIGFGAGLKAVK
jgi:hypothetical protein